MNYDPCTFDPSSVHSFSEMYPSLEYLRGDHPSLVKRIEEALDRAREFRRKHVDPCALEIDRRTARDPTYIHSDLLAAACDYGLFSLIVPRFFGGEGMPNLALSPVLEEIGAGCMGFANLIGVHFLGFGCILAAAAKSPDVMDRVCRAMVAGEKSASPISWPPPSPNRARALTWKTKNSWPPPT